MPISIDEFNAGITKDKLRADLMKDVTTKFPDVDWNVHSVWVDYLINIIIDHTGEIIAQRDREIQILQQTLQKTMVQNSIHNLNNCPHGEESTVDKLIRMVDQSHHDQVQILTNISQMMVQIFMSMVNPPIKHPDVTPATTDPKVTPKDHSN